MIHIGVKYDMIIQQNFHLVSFTLILYLYCGKRRDIRWNIAGALGKSRGLRLYFILFPDSSHNTDSTKNQEKVYSVNVELFDHTWHYNFGLLWLTTHINYNIENMLAVWLACPHEFELQFIEEMRNIHIHRNISFLTVFSRSKCKWCYVCEILNISNILSLFVKRTCWLLGVNLSHHDGLSKLHRADIGFTQHTVFSRFAL